MGGGGGGIDWNPMHSTLGTAVTDPGKAFEQIKGSLNPMDSTLGKFAKGDAMGGYQDIASGAQNAAQAGLDVGTALITGAPAVIKGMNDKDAANREQTKQAGIAAGQQRNAQIKASQDAADAANQKAQSQLIGQQAQAGVGQANSLENSLQSALQLKRQRGTQMYGGM